MSRTGWIILILCAALAVIGVYVTMDPQQAQRLEQMRRDIAFTGQAREIAMLVFFLGVGGFVAYLLFTRR